MTPAGQLFTLNYPVTAMRFRLVFDGSLPADNDRKSTVLPKQNIRRKIHAQLIELFRTHPALKPEALIQDEIHFIGDPGLKMDTAEKMIIGNFTFSPLVREKLFTTCHLDILLLRRAKPGSIVFPGGDVDNRIKVLLDALRVPDQPSQLPVNDVPRENKNPFFVSCRMTLSLLVLVFVRIGFLHQGKTMKERMIFD